MAAAASSGSALRGPLPQGTTMFSTSPTLLLAPGLSVFHGPALLDQSQFSIKFLAAWLENTFFYVWIRYVVCSFRPWELQKTSRPSVDSLVPAKRISL
jgi:hypothetical protein